jgi:uncharacterized protein with von Willebrand factor type A (vWA) domain
MNLQKNSEFVRLVHNEPLTLICSALADFLWEDFIRDTKPNVTYLVDTYNIKQLSRFGKEVFERLYSADEVKWLISDEDFEEYFRAVCDGDTKTTPKGYKPENALWYSIMGDLSQAAAWPTLLQRCVGEQFNSGNNSVRILNEISKVIEDAIEQNTLDVQLLIGSGDQLQQLRDQYNKAVQDGDKAEANAARAQGKELGQKIHNALQNLKSQVQAETNTIVDKVLNESDEQNEEMNSLFGSMPGNGKMLNDLQEKRNLAARLSRNKTLKQIAKKLGALRRVWTERKRAKPAKSNYEAVTGAKFSDSVINAFPTELALAGSKEGQALFALKYSQKTILTKDYTASRTDLGRGPVVMYVDVSGSMHGELELWSKAIALVISEQALLDKRAVRIHLFDTVVGNSVEIKSGTQNTKELIDFVAGWTLGGGTSFNSVLSHVVGQKENLKNSDILVLTDGNSEASPAWISRVESLKNETGAQITTICLDMSVPDVCKQFSDETYSVDTSNNIDSIDVIQKCIR